MVTAAVTAATLVAASVACLVGLPRPAVLRLESVRAARSSPRPAPPAWSLSALAVVSILLLLGPVAALLGLLAVLIVRRARGVRRRAARRRVERRRAVEACAALAGELRAGRSPGDALTVAAELASGPSRDVLRRAASAARLGGDVAGALVPPGPLTAVAGRVTAVAGPLTAVPEVLRALAVCWTVCAASGSGLALAVDRLEQGLRADQDRWRAVEAELAGPRATAGMLAVLPIAGLLLATGLGVDPVQVLLHTPFGLACLAGGLLLEGLGLFWTGRLVARAGGSG